MTIDWTAIGTHIANALLWVISHPAETAGTVTLIAGWFGWSKKLKEDAAMARARLRFDRLRSVGEMAYGKAAFDARKADGSKANKLAAALEAADHFLGLLSEHPASEEEKKLLAGLFTAKHEDDTIAVANPSQPAVGC